MISLVAYECRICGAKYENLLENGFGDFQCGFCLNCFEKEPDKESDIISKRLEYFSSELYEIHNFNRKIRNIE